MIPPYLLFHSQAYERNSFFSQELNYLGLGGNRGMVGTRYPAGIFSLHTGSAYQHILNGVIEAMPHVKYTGYVGRGNNDRKGLPLVGNGMKIPLLDPMSIPFSFD
jgi:hypothetical protein